VNAGGAQLLLLDASGHSKASSLIVAIGDEATDIPTTGAFKWAGVQFVANRTNLNSITTSQFIMTARLGSGNGTLIHTTSGSNPAFNLSSVGHLNTTSGEFVTSSVSLSVGGGTSFEDLRYSGRVVGSRGAGVIGVFATTQKTGQQYAGGFIGISPQIVVRVKEFADGTGIGRAQLGLAGRSTGRLMLLSDDLSEIIDEANSVNDATRQSAIIANLNPALSAASTWQYNTAKRVGTLAYKSASIATTVYEASYANARLVAVASNAATNTDALLVAGGDAFASGTYVGDYTWKGVQLLGTRGSLGNIIANPTTGSFTITADFANNSFAYATSNASPDFTLSATGGAIDAATGRLSTTTASLTPAAMPGETPGEPLAVRIDGLLHGAALGVSGVFATTADTGTQYGGAFVGSGEIEAWAVETITTEYGVGRADIGFTGLDDARFHFVSDGHETLINAANSPKNSVRAAALLHNIDPDFSARRGTADNTRTQSA